MYRSIRNTSVIPKDRSKVNAISAAAAVISTANNMDSNRRRMYGHRFDGMPAGPAKVETRR